MNIKNMRLQDGAFGLAGGSRRKAAGEGQLGIVQHWSPSAGAGFVAGDDGATYFVPVGNLAAGLTSLFTSQRVRFTAVGDVATVVEAL